jgi:hypothetical protein
MIRRCTIRAYWLIAQLVRNPRGVVRGAPPTAVGSSRLLAAITNRRHEMAVNKTL